MTDKSSATLNDHDEGVFYRLRQKMNNKNYKQWDDHWNNNVPTNDCFTDYKHQATECQLCHSRCTCIGSDCFALLCYVQPWSNASGVPIFSPHQS